MRTKHLAAAIVASVPSALLTASCVQGPPAEVDIVASNAEDAMGERVGDAAEALTVVNCKGLGLDVVECMIHCAESGIPCRPRMQHPRKADAGDGDLYRCGQLGSRKFCAYEYDNGDSCSVISGIPWIPCIYKGG